MVEKFRKDLKKALYEVRKKEYDSIIFLCVGTDKVTGDAFGPIIGENLKEIFRNYKNVQVIGDLEKTITFTDLKLIKEKIYEEYKKPCIVVIDAAISESSNIGKIFVETGQICLGSGLNKSEIIVGEINIKGVVAKNLNNKEDNFIMLQNTKLGLVMKMAKIVIKVIDYEMNKFLKTGKNLKIEEKFPGGKNGYWRYEKYNCS